MFYEIKKPTVRAHHRHDLESLGLGRHAIVLVDSGWQLIWKDDDYFTGRSMDVYVTKLRKYLSADPHAEIVNLHGNGFRLVVAS